VDRFFHTIALREVTIVTKERKRWNIRAERRDKNQLKRVDIRELDIRERIYGKRRGKRMK
jgi:hypothetical protein